MANIVITNPGPPLPVFSAAQQAEMAQAEMERRRGRKRRR